MLRACAALAVWVLLLVVMGIPVFLLGLVYPSRRVLAWAAKLWARLMLDISGVRLTIRGAERLRPGQACFFVGNHQSDLDIPILIDALGGDVRFLAKRSLFYLPVFGWVLGRYGFVPIDRADARRSHRTLQSMVRNVRRSPISFAVFPEGTRSRDGRLQTFRKGSMKICIRSGLPVVPFSIDGAHAVHHRDEFLHARPGPVTLTFGEPIPGERVEAMSPTELHDQIRAVIARQLGHVEESQPLQPLWAAVEKT